MNLCTPVNSKKHRKENIKHPQRKTDEFNFFSVCLHMPAIFLFFSVLPREPKRELDEKTNHPQLTQKSFKLNEPVNLNYFFLLGKKKTVITIVVIKTSHRINNSYLTQGEKKNHLIINKNVIKSVFHL